VVDREPCLEDDVQLLLEITYKNYRITRVDDVSENGQDYFDQHFSDEFIQEKLGHHNEWRPPF
jgi:hypothetical protein